MRDEEEENPFEALRRILLGRGWTKNTAANARGELCLVGAIMCLRYIPVPITIAQQSNAEWTVLSDPVLIALRHHVGARASWWNDSPSTTFADVMDLLDVCSREWKEAHA